MMRWQTPPTKSTCQTLIASDIAAQGRECVAWFPKLGPGVMAELDMVLARFGVAWKSPSRSRAPQQNDIDPHDAG